MPHFVIRVIKAACAVVTVGCIVLGVVKIPDAHLVVEFSLVFGHGRNRIVHDAPVLKTAVSYCVKCGITPNREGDDQRHEPDKT